MAGLLLAWEISVCTPIRLGDSNPVPGAEACQGRVFALLSKPSEIYNQLVAGRIDLDRLRLYTFITLANSTLGLLLAGLFAVIWFWYGARYEVVRRAGYGFVWFFQVVPYIAFAWVFSIVFAGFDKAVFGFLVAVFPLIGSLLNALRNVPLADKELMAMFSAPHRVQMLHLFLPRGTSYIFNGLSLAAPLSVVGVMIADLSGGDTAGLGKQIFISVRNANPAEMWVYTAAAIAVSLFLCVVVWVAEVLFARSNRWYVREAESVGT